MLHNYLPNLSSVPSRTSDYSSQYKFALQIKAILDEYECENTHLVNIKNTSCNVVSFSNDVFISRPLCKASM